MTIHWNEENLNRLQEMLNKEISVKTIAEIFGVSRGRIGQVINDYCLEKPSWFKRGGSERNVWDGEKLEKLKEMLENPEVTLKETAEYFGVKRQRIHQLSRQLEETGLKPKITCRRMAGMTKEQRRIHRLLKSKGASLVVEDLTIPTHCPILGLKLDYSSKKGRIRTDHSPSIDRIDNDIGYKKGNVIVCSWRANRIKNDGTSDEHRKIADFLDNYEKKEI